MVYLKWFLNLGENTNRELRIRTIYEWQQVIYGDGGLMTREKESEFYRIVWKIRLQILVEVKEKN